MSSASRSNRNQLKRAERLKKELVKFVTKGDLKEEYRLQRKICFDDAAHSNHANEAESVLDWFLFDWYNDDGDGAIAQYMDAQPALDDADREILLDWLDSINSVFEVLSTSRNAVQLRDLDSESLHTVKPRPPDSTFKTGEFVISRLLPLGDELILSGPQFVMPDREAALAWLDMNRAFAAFDPPEAIETARREQCTAFCELFGSDELTVPSGKLNSTLERFQRYLLTERRDPKTGMTTSEKSQKELGQKLTTPFTPRLPEPLAGAGEVTILCDDFDGIVLLPDFNRFKLVFESDRPNKQVADWKELVWTYIKNPDIPIVAFERVAEQHPVRVEKVLRSLIGDKDFSLEHLYAVLLHYKQPVDGLEDLKDDQQLWDLFNGNTVASKPRRSKRAKTGKRSAGSRIPRKPRTKATTKQPAKRVAARRTGAGSVSSLKRKPSAKRKANPTATRSARSAKSRPRKSTSTRR